MLAQLWELYLENEYLRADTWDEIEGMLNAYVVEQKQREAGEQ